MSSNESERLIEKVEDEAEMQGVELDAVRQVDSDANGITIRVLETDADNEADQVGFQVTKPNVETGRTMFNKRLSDGMRSLRDILKDDDDGSDDDSEEEFEPESETSSETTEAMSDMASSHDEYAKPSTETTHQEVGEFELTASVDDESLEALRDELDTMFDEVNEEFVTSEEAEAIDDRLDDLDDRLTSLEETLSMLGTVGDGG